MGPGPAAQVTRVAGLEEYLIALEPLAAALQLRFAASCAVAELPGSAKQHEKQKEEVVLQGAPAHARINTCTRRCAGERGGRRRRGALRGGGGALDGRVRRPAAVHIGA